MPHDILKSKNRNIIWICKLFPPFLIRWGNVVLIVIVVLLFLTGYCLYCRNTARIWLQYISKDAIFVMNWNAGLNIYCYG